VLVGTDLALVGTDFADVRGATGLTGTQLEPTYRDEETRLPRKQGEPGPALGPWSRAEAPPQAASGSINWERFHLDGHDLRGCALEKRKALLAGLLAGAPAPRVLYVDHVVGLGAALYAQIREIGCEGIVSTPLGSLARRAGRRRTGARPMRRGGQLRRDRLPRARPLPARRAPRRRGARGRHRPGGRGPFGFQGKHLWHRLNPLRAGNPGRDGVVPVKRTVRVEVKHFGRHKGVWIRDGVVVGVEGA
jgi:hypothetical protein